MAESYTYSGNKPALPAIFEADDTALKTNNHFHPHGLFQARYWRVWDLDEDFVGADMSAVWAENIDGAGPPTGLVTSGLGVGVYRATTEATSERQGVLLFHGDKLHFNADNGILFDARFRYAPAGATFTADERIYIGLASSWFAVAETATSAVDDHLLFKIEGADLSIHVDTDDGATEASFDTTIDSVKSAWIRVSIDATDLTKVKFYIDGVEVSTTVDVSAMSADTYLQPVVVIQRDAGTEVNTLDVDYIRVSVGSRD